MTEPSKAVQSAIGKLTAQIVNLRAKQKAAMVEAGNRAENRARDRFEEKIAILEKQLAALK